MKNVFILFLFCLTGNIVFSQCEYQSVYKMCKTSSLFDSTNIENSEYYNTVGLGSSKNEDKDMAISEAKRIAKKSLKIELLKNYFFAYSEQHTQLPDSIIEKYVNEFVKFKDDQKNSNCNQNCGFYFGKAEVKKIKDKTLKKKYYNVTVKCHPQYAWINHSALKTTASQIDRLIGDATIIIINPNISKENTSVQNNFVT